MNFTEMLAQVRAEPAQLCIPPQWGQGRTSFGGLLVALAYEVMRGHVPAQRPLRSLAVTFVGPALVQAPLSVAVEVLREGASVSQLLARVEQAGQVVALLQGSFGAGRESQVAVTGLSAPVIAAPEQCAELPFMAGITPEFTRYLALRWAIGGMPFSADTSRQMGGWVRLREEPSGPLEEAHLLALVDAWPPAVLSHLAQPAPGSSLTWTVELMQPLPPVQGGDWCLYRAEIERARDGYGHVAAALWGPGGELLALSRQTVTVFA